MHPINIELTEHVCLRYIERFDQKLNSIADYKARLKQAEIAIIALLRTAHYVADNEQGIILHNPEYSCNLIIRNRKLITLYRPDRTGKRKKRKVMN